MVQQLIKERFALSYSVFYIAEWLNNLGFSYQKAAFVSDHLDDVARRRWRSRVWPEIVRLARENQALLLFGDEASFPQWGTFTSTWVRRGTQPVVKTSGKRRGWNVFGLIDYFTGRFFHQGLEGRSRVGDLHGVSGACASTDHRAREADPGRRALSHERGHHTVLRRVR